MTKFDVLHEYGEELEQRMRLRTFPLAVKMLEKEGDIPEGAERPMKDFGYHLSACQGFSKSRREGTLIAMTIEDMWCPEGVIGLGLAEPPQYFLDGYHRFPQVAESLEAGSVSAREFPRLEFGKYIGVMAAPLMTANFAPDVVIVYCDAAQLGTLIQAAGVKDGHELTCRFSTGGACVYSIVPPIQSRQYQISVPCPGDRRFAGAQHDEMIFSLPIHKLGELLSSLIYLDDYGYRLPLRCVMKPEAELPGNYLIMGKMMGMDWMKGD